MEDNERAPKSVMEAAAKAPARIQPKQEISTMSAHRYFRIPFVRPSKDPSDQSEFSEVITLNKTLLTSFFVLSLQRNAAGGTHISMVSTWPVKWSCTRTNRPFFL